MKPIKSLAIRRDDTKDGYSEMAVEIDENGAIVLSGVDAGEEVRQFFGDWDFEFWLTIPPEYKEAVLLHLIKDSFLSQDRFSSVHKMRKWLEERDIPFQFTSF
jgi:hypothetical protein